jgi:putative hydrolase of the HAD superfamily
MQAIIFDADGVVINRDLYFSQQFSQEFNIPLEKLEAFFHTEFVPCITGRADLKVVLEPYLKAWGWNKGVDELLKYWFSTEDRPNTELLNQIVQLQAQDIKCYLATNQEKYRAHYLAENMGFLKRFDYLFFSCEMHRRKPEQEYFDYLWDSIQYLDFIDDKKEVLLFDDTPTVIDAANAFGFQAHLYQNLEQFEQIIKSNP